MTQDYASNGMPLPLVTNTSKPFFDAALKGRFIMQHCPRDGFFFYPRTHCPHCLGVDWEWKNARPTGEIYSFTVDRIGFDPAQRGRTPYAICVVNLDDGPRIVGSANADDMSKLSVGRRVALLFKGIEGSATIEFAPI